MSAPVSTGEIRFTERYDEQLARHAMALATAPSRRDRLFQAAVAMLLAAGLAYLAYSLASEQPVVTTDWLVRRLIVVFLGLGLLFGPIIQRRQAANAMWQHKQSVVASGRIDNEGIAYESGQDEEVAYPWTEIARVREDGDMPLLVLLTKEGMLLGLARPFFDSESDWQKARELVQTENLYAAAITVIT